VEYNEQKDIAVQSSRHKKISMQIVEAFVAYLNLIRNKLIADDYHAGKLSSHSGSLIWAFILVISPEKVTS